MPEQLSNPKFTRARAVFARRLALAASLSVAACAATTQASAQNGSKPQSKVATSTTATQATKPRDAQVKANDAREKKKAAPANASEITRARRAATPAADAKPSAAPSAKPSAKPSAAPAPAPAVAQPSAVTKPSAVAVKPVAPAVAVEADAASASKHDAASKSKGEEAELERLRAGIKDTKASAERVRLQRALVERLVELKREPEALDALRLMIHEDRFDPPFFFNTGNALARLGDASAAEDAYRKAILQRRGNYSRALNNLGVILIRQGHWDEAQETLAAALLQENYAYPEASYNLGRLHLLRGEADLAIREWMRTLRLEPTHTDAAVALARAYAEDGDTKRGLAVLDNFVARSMRAGGGGTGVAREIAEARRELVEAASAKGETNDADAKTSAGEGGSGPLSSDANLRSREVDRATYSLLQTARERREQGSYEESVKNYRNVLARSPAGYFPPANLELGAALINLKRDEEAIAALTPLTERDGARYPVAYYHLGRLYERQGELERAARSFARAAELYGDANPQALIDLSRTREKTGDAAGALAAMNAYAASIARQGSVPAWVAERQAKLRQKAAASSASSAPKSATPKP
jgi:tetratricopeptide (TPR) repeat protein